MAHVLFYESGAAPSSRSIRELTALRRAGWDISVAHEPGRRDEVIALGFRSVELPSPPGNSFRKSLKIEQSILSEYLHELNRMPGGAANRGSHLLADIESQIKALTEKLESWAMYRRGLQERIDRSSGGRAAVLKARRKLFGAWLRLVGARREALLLRGLKAQREEVTNKARVVGTDSDIPAVEARLRAVRAAMQLMTPLTEGGGFGDLSRMETRWPEAARIMAAIKADVLWAADLDALPPVVWAARAAATRTPVVFDSHELYCDLDYLPEAFRSAWRQVAARFIPEADLVLTVSQEIAAVLEREHGAKRTAALHNLAVAGDAPTRGLRTTLELAAEVPLVVHIGRMSPGRNPGYVVPLLAALPEVHVAFVGTAAPGVIEQVKEMAEQSGVSARLHMVEPVPLNELVEFVADADMSVITYDGRTSRNYEMAMPNKLFDALAAGLPVVAAEGTAVARFLVQERLGRVFPIETPPEFAKAVTETLDDKEMRQRVRERAPEFVFSSAESEFSEMLGELISSDSRPVRSRSST